MDDAVRPETARAEAVPRETARADAVRGEAARLLRRLEGARGHLDRARDRRGSGAAEGSGVDDDDEVRALLGPAAARIARLAELTGALADGTLTEDAAGTAARAVADSQPHRRSR
ncbi:hypothetical protein [Dietzia sp. CH92]|uniref:hypothetical protein n=1 Tax=Dietzia sp. CH92 TaxID=3051823 RepID=UPI0028D57F03|nr:hypothetical protein [Dietzia sp. CH92]